MSWSLSGHDVIYQEPSPFPFLCLFIGVLGRGYRRRGYSVHPAPSSLTFIQHVLLVLAEEAELPGAAVEVDEAGPEGGQEAVLAGGADRRQRQQRRADRVAVAHAVPGRQSEDHREVSGRPQRQQQSPRGQQRSAEDPSVSSGHREVSSSLRRRGYGGEWKIQSKNWQCEWKIQDQI